MYTQGCIKKNIIVIQCTGKRDRELLSPPPFEKGGPGGILHERWSQNPPSSSFAKGGTERLVLADWELAVNGQKPFPIDPLR